VFGTGVQTSKEDNPFTLGFFYKQSHELKVLEQQPIPKD